MEQSYPIDVVIPWVDDSDPQWRAEKRRFRPEEGSTDDSEARYRDWGTLKYIFRGIEKFAPWVNKVYFVTCGHVPDWLNLDAPKLVHVRHSDYLPAEYLPTFSANPIELNLHRIEALSEHFVYFNDDTFPIRPVEPELFFRDGIPVHPCELQPVLTKKDDVPLMPHIYLNDISLINRHFSCKESVSRNRGKWFSPSAHFKKALWHNFVFSRYRVFPGIRNEHMPVPLLKSTLMTLWDEEYDVLHNTSLHRFRDMRDVNQYVFRYWQIASGNFRPIRRDKVGKYLVIREQTEEICQAIRRQKYPIVCLNDMDAVSTREQINAARKEIQGAFEDLFPEKSCFER